MRRQAGAFRSARASARRTYLQDRPKGGKVCRKRLLRGGVVEVADKQFRIGVLRPRLAPTAPRSLLLRHGAGNGDTFQRAPTLQRRRGDGGAENREKRRRRRAQAQTRSPPEEERQGETDLQLTRSKSSARHERWNARTAAEGRMTRDKGR